MKRYRVTREVTQSFTRSVFIEAESADDALRIAREHVEHGSGSDGWEDPYPSWETWENDGNENDEYSAPTDAEELLDD